MTDESLKLVGLMNGWPEHHRRAAASLVIDYAKSWGLFGNPNEPGADESGQRHVRHK